jgi:hypothetical protein
MFIVSGFKLKSEWFKPYLTVQKKCGRDTLRYLG